MVRLGVGSGFAWGELIVVGGFFVGPKVVLCVGLAVVGI